MLLLNSLQISVILHSKILYLFASQSSVDGWGWGNGGCSSLCSQLEPRVVSFSGSVSHRILEFLCGSFPFSSRQGRTGLPTPLFRGSYWLSLKDITPSHTSLAKDSVAWSLIINCKEGWEISLVCAQEEGKWVCKKSI